MKRMKSILSWLLVFVMIISLVPVTPARAEGENGYSVYLYRDIRTKGVTPYNTFSYTPEGDETIMPDWDISVPEQDNVAASGNDDWRWTVNGDFTFYVTIPEGCDVQYLYLENNGERMEGVSFVPTEVENQYSVTVTPTDNINIEICDATYCSIIVEDISGNFDTEIPSDVFVDGTEGTEGTYYYKNGGSYTLNIKKHSDAAENVDISNLIITVNGVNVTSELVSGTEGDWSYALGTVTEEQTIRVYESDTKFSVHMPDLSNYGYEIYDEGEETKIDYSNGVTSYEVEQNGTLTFIVKELANAEITTEYGLCIGEEELVPTENTDGSRSYTISDITWNTDVSVFNKVALMITDDSNNPISFIPCDADGTSLGANDSSVEKYYVREWSYIYFKLDAGDKNYRITDSEGNVITSDNGIYILFVEYADVSLKAKELNIVSYQNADAYYIQVDNVDDSYVWVDDEREGYSSYYTEGTFIFSVVVYNGYNSDYMTVKLKGEAGEENSLTSLESTTNEYGEMIYKFETPTITENVEIVVEGIVGYTDFRIIYAPDKLNGIGIKLEDVNGSSVELDDTYGMLQGNLLEGQYTLVLTGSAEDLASVKMRLDGVALTGTPSDGQLRVDINIENTSSALYLTKGEEYYITAVASEGSLDYAYLCEYGDYAIPIAGYYPKGEVRFWIAEQDDTFVTTAEAAIVSIKDSDGKDVSYAVEENVEVESGKLRTVYTVDLTSDIVVEYSGVEYRKYDVTLPLPDSEADYTISPLYQLEYIWDDEAGCEIEQRNESTGEADTTNGYTHYGDIQVETIVYFDITTSSAGEIPPSVEMDITHDGYVETNTLNLHSESSSDNGMKTYTYSFDVRGNCDIAVSANPQPIQLEVDSTKEYTVEYQEMQNVWFVYDTAELTEDPYAEPVLIINGLPKYVNTDRQYKFTYDIYASSLMLDEMNADQFLTAKNANNEEKLLSPLPMEAEEVNVYYEMPIQDGYYTLVVNMDLLETRNGKVSLKSHCDDMTISIAGTADTDYEILEGQDYEYKVKNQQLTFSVTADNTEVFNDDYFLSIPSYTWDGTYVGSDDGLTRTYTVTDVEDNGTIAVSRAATVHFLECVNGGVSTNVYSFGYNVNGERMEHTYLANSPLALAVYVDEGYDMESISVLQEYTDADGNSQTIQYNTFEDVSWQAEKACEVVLQPGVNIFSITQPEKKTYAMTLPTDDAYGIELVDGSTNPAEYGEAFSFKVNANEGYDLSGIVVEVDGETLTADGNGVYTISNVKEERTIAISGAKLKQYTVKFVDHDGTEIKTETVEHGKAATAPADPAREGYTFVEWDTDFTNVTQDITVTATYTANTYTITLPTDTAYTIELVNGSETTVAHGGTFSFKVNANEGYDLSAIVVKASEETLTADGNGVYTISDVKEERTIAISGAKLKQYTVKFVDHDGTEIKTETVEHGKAATAPADPAREGYTFVEWDTDFANVTQDITVTAIYTDNTVETYIVSLPTDAAYTIELVNGSETTVAHGGTFSFKVNANEGYDLSAIVVKASEETLTADGNGVYTISNVKEERTIAISGAKLKQYTVKFVDHDGTVIKTETVEHGKNATAPTNPTREGYSFTGWNTTFTKVTKDIMVTATYSPVLVTKLTIKGDYKNLAVGKTMRLTVTATPSNALNTDVVWRTSNKKWATVSKSGKVKALKKGAGKTVKITATAQDGSGVKATYKIKIYKNAIKKIKLTAKTKTVKAGKKLTIKAQVTPTKGIYKKLKWSSSNKKWATVNSKGVVKTKKAGKGKTVKITAKALDGSNKKATIKIKIKK